MNIKKITTIKILVFLGLMCAIWGGYLFIRYRIVTVKRQQIQICEDDFSWVYQVEKEKLKEKELVLSGFAFQVEADANNAYEVVLNNLESGENVFSKTEYVIRQDVNKYFSCEYDYSKSGFVATFLSKTLDLQNQKYEVLVHVLGKKRAYRTGIYIVNGQVVFENPLEFKPLSVDGTDIERIVNDGFLRVYGLDYGMYVYQYEGDLYWIAESDYEFDEKGETYVQWHLETSQIEKLPEGRLENKWYFDNLGFYFKEKELNEWNTGKYRVAKMKLPTEYSIIRMNTGCHENGWIWKQDFRPYYHFNE